MFIPVYVQAQNSQKIGHADWEYIFSHLPESKQIEKDLKTYEAQLQNQLKLKSQELEAKYKSYQSLPADTPEAIRKDKESELAYLQDNIENFKRNAQASIEKRQHDLIGPVFTKVGQAIQAVATEHGYSYIINPQMLSGGDVLLFSDQKYNISNLVLKKLGVVIPASETERRN
jgi:outer membrane protein